VAKWLRLGLAWLGFGFGLASAVGYG
jgi:hypothetical protein